MTTPTITDHPNAALGLRMLSPLLAGDEPTALSLVHPDHVDHAPTGDLHGRDGISGVMRWMAATLTDREELIEDVIATDDRVVVRCRLSATHAGELLGVPATGRRFVTHAVHIWRVEDGMLAEHWMFRDDVATLRQLGAKA